MNETGMLRAMRLAVLGSGSGGNTAVIEAGGTRLLIDAGLSARQIVRRLSLLGIELESLSGILITHEHGDHIRGLKVLTKSCSVPLYATAQTCQVVREQVGPAPWKIFPCGGGFKIGGIEIESFLVPHDAVEPVGFVFRRGDHSLGILSDAGHVPATLVERLRSVRMLFIEANYDDSLLESDRRRPWSIKQRIASRHGHLSNAQTAEVIGKLAGTGLEQVILGHLSRDCNAMETALAAIAPHGIATSCASQDEPTPWFEAPAPPCRIAFSADELFGSRAGWPDAGIPGDPAGGPVTDRACG